MRDLGSLWIALGCTIGLFGETFVRWGLNMARILSEDIAKDSLALDIVSFAKSTKSLWF